MPWCVQKCPYCDFNSHTIRERLPEARYLRALKADLAFEAERFGQRHITSIFFGGGTPSLFSGDSIADILKTVRALFEVAPDAEITLEANPGTADAGRFQAYYQAGINRLSLGIQSRDDTKLKRLGRIHNAAQAVAACELAEAAGFDNINLDIMFGLSDQTGDEAMADLQAVIDLQPAHISWYQLTVEPNTLFAIHPPALPSTDECLDMQEAGIALLEEYQYRRYEVSAFSKSGKQCRHNLNYWNFGDYLGVGAGAHSKLSIPAVTRHVRKRHPSDYMRHAGCREVFDEIRTVEGEELLFEFLLNNLRLTAGFTYQALKAQTGFDRTMLIHRLAPFFDKGMLRDEGGKCVPSRLGYRFLDQILLDVLPEPLQA